MFVAACNKAREHKKGMKDSSLCCAASCAKRMRKTLQSLLLPTNISLGWICSYAAQLAAPNNPFIALYQCKSCMRVHHFVVLFPWLAKKKLLINSWVPLWIQNYASVCRLLGGVVISNSLCFPCSLLLHRATKFGGEWAQLAAPNVQTSSFPYFAK